MNEQIRQGARRPTQAAEGVPRWRWTTAELLRLTELGAFGPEDRFELIGGEIVPMSPKGRRHEVLREELERWLRARETLDCRVVGEPQLNLADDAYAFPDLIVRPSDVRTPDVRGDTVLLVVEVADSSRDYDLTTKARLYALHGVREYWVIDARTLETHVHRDPSATGFGSVTVLPPAAELAPSLARALIVRLAALDLD